MAQLAVAGSRGRQPVLQTAAVDGGQASGTLAGGQQFLLGPAVVADPTHGALWQGAEEKEREGSKYCTFTLHALNRILYSDAG